jgi:hypothetical protein
MTESETTVAKANLIDFIKWFGDQTREGGSTEQILERVMRDPDLVAAEIGIPVETLSMDVFGRADSQVLIDAMAETAINDIIEHDPDGGFAKFSKRNEA